MAAEILYEETLAKGLRNIDSRVQELTISHHQLQKSVEAMGNKLGHLQSTMEKFITEFRQNFNGKGVALEYEKVEKSQQESGKKWLEFLEHQQSLEQENQQERTALEMQELRTENQLFDKMPEPEIHVINQRSNMVSRRWGKLYSTYKSRVAKMQGGSTGIGYGLKYQARCIANVKEDTDHTSFITGTFSLKEENEVHLIRLSSGGTELICEGLFSHPNEIWNLTSCRFDQRIFSNVFSSGGSYGAAIWQIPELYGQLNSLLLERFATLDAHKSKAKCIPWWPTGKHDKLISIDEQNFFHNIDYDSKKKYMLVTTEDESGIHVWDLLKIHVLELPGHAHWTWVVRCNPKYEGLIASVGTESAVNLWIASLPSGENLSKSWVESTPLNDWFKDSLEDGKMNIWVNSYHHQGVKKLDQRFVPMAFTPDGLIEVFYDLDSYNPNEGKYTMGLQFHPEQMSWQEFQWLVELAAKMMVFDPGGMQFWRLQPPNLFSSILEDKDFLRRVECYEVQFIIECSRLAKIPSNSSRGFTRMLTGGMIMPAITPELKPVAGVLYL